jgi:hypothetical protein
MQDAEHCEVAAERSPVSLRQMRQDVLLCGNAPRTMQPVAKCASVGAWGLRDCGSDAEPSRKPRLRHYKGRPAPRPIRTHVRARVMGTGGRTHRRAPNGVASFGVGAGLE